MRGGFPLVPRSEPANKIVLSFPHLPFWSFSQHARLGTAKMFREYGIVKNEIAFEQCS